MYFPCTSRCFGQKHALRASTGKTVGEEMQRKLAEHEGLAEARRESILMDNLGAARRAERMSRTGLCKVVLWA